MSKKEPLVSAGESKRFGYVYRADNYSVLDGIINPYLTDPIMKITPYGLPANIITIFSNTLVFLAMLLALRGRHDVFSFWFIIPIFVLSYLIGDCIDGLQARRTKTGSPLGEFMDHFLDCFVTGELMISIFAAYNLSNVWIMCIVLTISYWTQASAFWEKYKTHHMYFGKFSSSETVVTLCIIIFVACFKVIREFLKTSLISFGFVQNLFGSNLSWFTSISVIELILCISSLIALINVVLAVVRAGGADFRFVSYCLLALLVAVMFCLRENESVDFMCFTISLYNISYIGTLLISIVTKKNDKYSDFILPAFLVIAIAVGLKSPFVLYGAFGYILLVVLVKAARFIHSKKECWVWKNPENVE